MTSLQTENIPKQRWLKIIPPTIIVYIFSFMDRTNISFAMAGGMTEELGMTASMAGLAAGIFFIGYLFLQVPGGHIAERGSAKKFIAATIFVWGGLATITGFITQVWHMLVLRFILGVAEGGVWPAVLVILSRWFPSEERARANAFFIMNLAIANVITGPLSGWIISAYGWRYVFFIEGAVSIALIFIWWPLMADRPEEAKWISPAERDYLVRRIKEEQESMKSSGGAPVSYKQIISDVNLWKLIGIYFFYQVGIYGFIMWFPTILKSLMNTGMTSVGLLSAVPYIATIGGLYLFAALSDRSMNRRLYTALPALFFAVCFVLATQLKENIWVSYAFLVMCGFFQQAYNGVFWTIPPALFPSEVAGGARGIINALGNLGGFFGPFIVGWIITNFHSTDAGIYALSFALFMAFCITMTLPSKLAGNTTVNTSSNTIAK